uniref:Uncharacterized protein n=1 Tax=Leersia perrieri TaxID=77586 RepID=A0A0D9XW51_9ORYZ
MIKLALQRGLHFEIAYSPLIADAASIRQAMPEAKLLVEWTKGKNLIISSAAHAASQIRGPYDAINLCAYLLRLSTQRAKAAISLNCRSLISKALRKKHFYKETIRIDRLLPNEQFNSANFKLAHWIGSDLMPHKVHPISLDKDELPAYKGDLQSLHVNPEPSSNKDDLPHLPINGLTKVSCHVPDDGDQPLFVAQQEQSSHDMKILYPLETQEGHVQVDRDETLKTCGLSNLPASFEHDSIATDLGSPVNDAHHVQTDTFSSVDPEGIEKHVEFLHDSVEIDGTESCKMSLIVESSDPLSSYDKLACSVIPCNYAQATQDCGILSGSSVCPKNKGLYSYSDIAVFSETPKDHAEPLELPPCGVDDEAPSDIAVHLHSDLCRDVMMPQRVIRDEVEPVDRRTATLMEEHTPYGPETDSTASLYDKGSSDTTCKTHELAKQNSNSLEGDVAKTNDELLQYSYASSNLKVPLTRAGKRTKKLRLQCPVYLPFLGFLKSVSFKKKASKYTCRKTLADSRPRVKSRFAPNSDDGPAAEATSAPADESFEVSPPQLANAVPEARATREQDDAVALARGETSEVVEGWFRSEKAAMAGEAEWDACKVKDAIVANGGGCHWLGWLGAGPWTVPRVRVEGDGQCGGCGCRLASVDIDVEETQRFADSVAGLALQRETKINFSQFQEWLKEHGEYEAIVDAANIALYQQNFADGGFSLTQRIAKLMENQSNRHLIETWRANSALYTSPIGYWPYAAIRLNCLLVTNDEMRDHIFELLGSSFFPKWKQRHQVKYTFSKGKAVLMMPPPYSSEIQESEMGSWHVPMEEKAGDESVGIWLCIDRAGPCSRAHEACATNGVVQDVSRTESSKRCDRKQSEDIGVSITGKRRDRRLEKAFTVHGPIPYPSFTLPARRRSASLAQIFASPSRAAAAPRPEVSSPLFLAPPLLLRPITWASTPLALHSHLPYTHRPSEMSIVFLSASGLGFPYPFPSSSSRLSKTLLNPSRLSISSRAAAFPFLLLRQRRRRDVSAAYGDGDMDDDFGDFDLDDGDGVGDDEDLDNEQDYDVDYDRLLAPVKPPPRSREPDADQEGDIAMVAAHSFVSTQESASDTVVDYSVDEDEFHKIRLLHCDFLIRKVPDPDDDVFDFREYMRCTKKNFGRYHVSEPPVEHLRDPLYKTEREIMKVFLTKHYRNRRCNDPDFFLDFEEIYVIDSKTRSITRAKVVVSVPEGKKRDKRNDLLLIRDGGESFRIIDKTKRDDATTVIQREEWAKSRQDVEKHFRKLRDFDYSNWF